VPPQYAKSPEKNGVLQIPWKELADQCAAANSQLYRFTTKNDLQTQLCASLANCLARSIYIEENQIWTVNEMQEFLRSKPDHLSIVTETDLIDALHQGSPEKSARRQLADCEVAITGADFLIVSTATVVKINKPGHLRLASLLPSIHLVLITASSILADLDSLFLRLAALAAMPSDVALITGPSRTADIEKVLVMPAHGPKELQIFVLDQE